MIYGSAAAYKAYFLARTGVEPTTTDAAIEAALLVASEYIDANYRGMFPGEKTGLRAQVREWPRTGAYDSDYQTIQPDEVPTEVEYATYEAAAVHIATPGSLRTNATMGTAIQSVSISGALSVTYAGAANIGDLQLNIPAVDAAISPVLTNDANVSSMSGASVRG